METLASLTSRYAQPGRLDWIGVRPARRADVIAVETARITEAGLEGDHQARPGKRAVTLIQSEHLPVIAALAGVDTVTPERLRRNLVVSGINLSALRHKEIAIGSAVLSLTGPCAPCSRMEEALGPGGYNAMRGHGGWTAVVVRGGEVSLGDAVSAVPGGG